MVPLDVVSTEPVVLQGIVVYVDDPAAGRGGLGHFVGVVRGGESRADVEELADALGPGNMSHRPGQKGPVGPRGLPDTGVDRHRRLTRGPVSGEVVLPT